LIKQLAINLLRMSGAFDLMRLTHRSRALILTYHRFSSGPETGHDPGKTPAAVFAEQLEYLTNRYTIVPLARLAESISQQGQQGRQGRSSSRLAAITIDDGYRDAYEIAYPLLRRYRASATLFVPTNFIDQRVWIWTDKARFLTEQAVPQQFTLDLSESSLRIDFNGLNRLNGAASRRDASERINAALKQLPNDIKETAIERLASALGVRIPERPPDEFGPVTWAEAREMQANGIEIGSHTLTHPILTNIGDEQLRRELRDSRSRLEEALKRRVDQFCYPNGDYDQRVSREVAQAGYRIAVTCVNGLNQRGENLLALRRVPAEQDLTRFAQGTCGFEELKQKARLLAAGAGRFA
jgi:peptidoglycan/xylan/chitin deacetylase (PgdA/CDA1 family)